MTHERNGALAAPGAHAAPLAGRLVLPRGASRRFGEGYSGIRPTPPNSIHSWVS
ncbi:hypothetical protein BJ962_006550 [Streptomyces aureorectus]|nr:hypothetical protein [Streptomyces calvus]